MSHHTCASSISNWTGGTIGCALAASFSFGAVSADEALQVPPVVVSGTRSAQSTVTIPASITVISREEIERSGARYIADVLRGRGAVQISDPFGDGSRTSVGIRGFGESANANTLILVDGRRLNNNDIGVPDLNSVSLKDVERIEIIEGSAGTLFGDQAVGGVINIITRSPRGFSAYAESGAGSYNSYQLGTGVSHALDNGLFYRLALEKRETDNYRDNNGLDYENYAGRAGLAYSSGEVFVDLQHVDEKLDTPAALFADEVAIDRRQVVDDFRNDFSDTETNVIRLGLRQGLLEGWAFEADLTNRESESEFLLSFREFPGLASNFQNRHLVSANPRLVGSHGLPHGDLIVTLGYDIEWADYKIDSVVGLQTNDQIMRGAYGQAIVPILPRTTLTIGARNASVENDLRDDFAFPNGVDIDDTELVTEFGLVFRPTSQWRLFARRDGNFRFAKVDEYTNAPPSVILSTQTGESYEGGVEWSDEEHRAKLVVFRLDLQDEIAFAPGAGAFGFGANINLEETRRDGFIIEGAWQASDALRLAADYSFIDARVTKGPFRGNHIPLVAENIARASVDYAPTAYWNLYAELQAISERVFSGDFDKRLGELSGYGVVNIGTELSYRGWTLSARINNLLDHEHSDFGARATLFPPPTFAPVELESFFPSPERNAFVTLRYGFE